MDIKELSAWLRTNVVPVDQGAQTECWVCPDRKPTRTGYLRMRFGGSRHELAHRNVYVTFVSTVSDDQSVAHLCADFAHELGDCAGIVYCRHRRCVRPDHLMAMSNADNLSRSPRTWTGVNVRKTECPQGHPLSGQNLMMRHENGREKRRCRECQLRHQRSWGAKSRAAARA